MRRIDLLTKVEQMIKDFVRVSLNASPEEVAFGHPCSHLIDVLLATSIQSIRDRLVMDQGREFRLNGAGLKLFWRLDEDEGDFTPHFNVSGDQYSRYPVTGPALNEIIRKNGLRVSLTVNPAEPIVVRPRTAKPKIRVERTQNAPDR